MHDVATRRRTGRTEDRDSAVRRLGRHWNLRYGPDNTTVEVVECLGELHGSNSDYDFAQHDRTRMQNKAREMVFDYAQRRIEDITERLNNNRFLIWKARRGWVRKSAEVLKRVAELEAERDAARERAEDLVERSDWRVIKEVDLPEVLHVPAPINIGDTVWEAHYEWPIEHGFKLCESRVVGIRVYDFVDVNHAYDVSINYEVKRLEYSRGLPSERGFQYQRDVIDPTVNLEGSNGVGFTGSKMFFGRDAAVEHLEAVKAKLREQMEKPL